jgi:sugar phosphate isomerase/epimerase
MYRTGDLSRGAAPRALGRRELLAGCLPSAAFAMARPRHVKLGIRTVVYKARPMREAARLMKSLGFQGVHLSLVFADTKLDMNSPDWSYAARARDVFGEAGLPIYGLDGYVRLSHPDPTTRAKNLEALGGMLENARRFGTNIVATEGSSSRRVVPGRPAPADPAAEFRIFIAALRGLIKRAEDSGAILALEPFAATVEDVHDILEEVRSPALKILWDAVHFLDPANSGDVAGELKRAGKEFGSQVVLAHANDYRIAAGKYEACAIGEGLLDYTTYVSLLDGGGREILLAAEHTREPDVERVKRYLDRFFT